MGNETARLRDDVGVRLLFFAVCTIAPIYEFQLCVCYLFCFSDLFQRKKRDSGREANCNKGNEDLHMVTAAREPRVATNDGRDGMIGRSDVPDPSRFAPDIWNPGLRSGIRAQKALVGWQAGADFFLR